MKKVFSVFLAFALALLAVSCGEKKSDPRSAAWEKAARANPKEKILFANSGPVEFFLHPWLNPGQSLAQKLIWDCLIGCDAAMNPTQGRLASRFGLNDAGDELSFEMRKGAKWHDGEAITAHDVQWSIEYSLKTCTNNSVFEATFKAIEGCDAFLAGKAEHISGISVDGDEIRIKFANVAPDALLTFTQFVILPQKHFEGQDPLKFQQSPYFQNPVGSGAFKVESVVMNGYCDLIPFEDYWGGKADFKVKLYPSSAEADENLVANALAGKVDYAYTKTYTDAQALSKAKGVKVYTVDVKYTRLFYCNKFNRKDGSKSPLADSRVRRAIRYAIDMDAICKKVFDGAAKSANSLTPNGAAKADGLDEYKFNPEKARTLLKEAGWDENRVLDMAYYYTDLQTIDLMAIIQDYLAKVGIKMKTRLVTGDMTNILWAHPADGKTSAVDWDMCYAAISAMSLHEYYDRLQKDAAINSHTPFDPTLESLVAATNASMDADAQKNAFFALQKYENETMTNIPLYYQPVWVVASDRLAPIFDAFPVIGNPQFHWDWNIASWKF